eukprot:CAMPEP_0179492070 /NCGR_PEP_ID=MMETSP0799-20121207/66543_1 /TAXON_ID=46947 /ORGANISM="Geminigera cryophila, Strain CCMP2564" /LENGTH=56 /DNA_ID=CAMNT_0021308799 /DNA_START=95 /DNA_END=262 /DNA_ORIENTATION=-
MSGDGEAGTREPAEGSAPRCRSAFMRSSGYEALSRRLPRNAERAAVVQGLIDATGI